MNSNRRLKRIARVLIEVTILWTLAACSQKPTANGDSPTEAVPVVTVTNVVRGNLSSMLTVTGTIAALPNEDVKVSSLVAGRIAGILVTEGDPIQQGQVLAKIEDHSYRDQVRQAEAALEQAKASLENAKLNLKRNENLVSRGIAARKDLEDARTQMVVSQAAAAQVAAALSLANLQLARTEVRSPLTGIVVKRFLSNGEQVDGTAATSLFEVANVNEVELFGNIPATYLAKVHIGIRLPVTSEAFPGKVFWGHVVALSAAVDPTTNIGLARIRIANPRGLLRLGMFLTAQLPLETHVNTLLIPSDALYRDPQDQPQVYRVHGDEADAVPVRLGIQTKNWVEVLSGVKEGEAIVLRGGYGLSARAKVAVKP